MPIQFLPNDMTKSNIYMQHVIIYVHYYSDDIKVFLSDRNFGCHHWWRNRYLLYYLNVFQCVYALSDEVRHLALHLSLTVSLVKIWALLHLHQIRAIESVHSLGPSDSVWRHRFRITLAQTMARCLTKPSHYPKQCGHQWDPVAFTWGQCHSNCSWYLSLLWKLSI